MPDRTHSCPGRCGTQVPYRLFACPTDWGRLPRPLRDAILATAKRRRTDPSAHRSAMLAASTWYRDNQHQAHPATPEPHPHAATDPAAVTP